MTIRSGSFMNAHRRRVSAGNAPAVAHPRTPQRTHSLSTRCWRLHRYANIYVSLVCLVRMRASKICAVGMSVNSELNGDNVPALGSSVKVGPTMLQVMQKQNLLLEQSNKQSIMTFNLLSVVLAQLKEHQSATSTKAGSSLKRSRTENEADGDQADTDEAHSEKKQTVSSTLSPTWSFVNHLLTPGLSASLFPLPHLTVGQLFAQHVAEHSPCSPIPFMALDRNRDLEAERNKYFMARA